MRVLDRFRNLTQMQQVLLVAAVVAACFAILLVVWLAFIRTPYRLLFGDLKPAEAATIIAELERRKIPYNLSNGGASISVPEDRVDVTRLNIMTEELPLKGTVGFELFNKADLGLTDFAQKINYLRAIQGELERTINALDGVASARVHISLGEDRVFQDDQVPPKASVTVRMAKKASLDPSAVAGIQRLVAAAIPKLQPNNVVVLDEEGRIVSAAPRDDAVRTSPVLQEKSAIEQFYEARIRQNLEQVYVGQNIDVRVVAGLAAGQPGWNPANRSFPLEIAISSSAGMAGDEAGLRSMVVSAVGFVRGDSVVFEVRNDQVVEPAPRPAPKAPQSATPRWVASVGRSEAHGWYWDLPYLVVPVLVLAMIAVLLQAAKRPKRLSDRERAKLAAQLREALEVSRASY